MGKPSAEAQSLLKRISCVVVDDNANTRRLLHDVLTAFGVNDIRLIGDGPTALESINLLPPDLILCDWNMRPMDGIEFLRRLRHHDNKNAKIPAIMLTGHTKPELVKAAMDAGANHFVAKPIVPGTLLKRIVWALHDPRSYVVRGDHFVLEETVPPPGSPAASGKKTAEAHPIWLVD